MNKPKPRFASLDDFFRARKKPATILDHVSDLRTIANQCGLHRSDVRANLPRLGYVKSKTVNGIACWRLETSNERR